MQKKGGLVTMRHNEVRHITTDLFSDVFQDTEVRKSLIKLWGEEQRLSATGKTRLFRYTGKKILGQEPKSICLIPTPKVTWDRRLSQVIQSTKMRKKHRSNWKIMKIDQGSFMLLVFTVNDGVRGECTVIYSKLASLISPFFEVWNSVYVNPVRYHKKYRKNWHQIRKYLYLNNDKRL